MTKTQILKKIGAIAANVLLYVFIFICILGVILTIVSKKDPDGAATIFGMQMRVVISPSMEKSDATDLTDFEIKDIPLRSMVFIETVPEDKAEADKWFSELKEGDVFLLCVLDEVLTYEVDQIRIVEPEDLSELEIKENEDLCTLITCTPYGVNSHRLLVRGHRIETVANNYIRVSADAMQIDEKIVASFVAVPILLLLLAWLLIRYRKRK